MTRGFAEIQEEESNVNSLYNSLQISWNRNFSHGYSFGVTYTLAKSFDNSSNYRDIVPDTYNTSNLWGPSEYDIRHVVIINYMYDLPFFARQQNLAGKLLGEWELTGSAQFQTGTPCGVGSNNDYAGVGEYGSFGCGNEGQFWVMSAFPSVPGGFAGPNGTAKRFSTTNANGTPIFTPPTPGTFNLQNNIRDQIYGPGFQNWNVALFKRFPISEKAGEFQFRAEAYNFVSHPNLSPFGQPGALNFNPLSPQFGEVTGKSPTNPRELQLSLRYQF